MAAIHLPRHAVASLLLLSCIALTAAFSPPLLLPLPSLRASYKAAPAARIRPAGGAGRVPGLRMAEGKPGEKGKDKEEPLPQEVVDLTRGIASIQKGLDSISAGLGLAATGAQEAIQDSLSSYGQQAFKSAQSIIGQEAFELRLQQAREALEEGIGIDEEGVPPVTDGPPFQLQKAVWLAGAAFDAYNNPTGGLFKRYEDGTEVAYTSSDCINELHSGVLVLKMKSANLQAAKGLLGGDSASCDPFLRVRVNNEVQRSKTKKQTLSPEWGETMVFYTGEIEDDKVEIQLYDADIPFGREDLDNVTADPLVGKATINMKEIVGGGAGWQELTLDLDVPTKPTTLQDEENRNNPYWLPIPREAMLQAWPGLLRGGAKGGSITVEAQFFPLSKTESVPKMVAPQADAPPAAINPEDLSVGDWRVLASVPKSSDVDESMFERERLARMCFMDNTETDTQVEVWRDFEGKRLVLAFRGTEQVKWKDLLTDALVVQQPFAPGAPWEDQERLPPLLESATKSAAKTAESEILGGVGGGGGGESLVDAGVLGSVFSSITSPVGVLEILRNFTGNQNYEIGDLSKNALKQLTGKEEYQFGDITKSVLKKIQTENYQFGDVTKDLLASWGVGGEEQQKAIEQAIKEEIKEEDKVLVHLGFLRGYLSLRDRIVDVTEKLTRGREDGWTVYVTGHSLGGALSTICALDLATMMPEIEVALYNYGSPRVGNMGFVKAFNEKVKEAFRVVNDADVVARVPRSKIQNYHHVGRTVLVSARGSDGKGSLWIEGESEGMDPLRERWVDLSKLLDAEVAFLQGLVKGESLGDHMEDAYYKALRLALGFANVKDLKELEEASPEKVEKV